jgi:peptide/nickel transport system substrate-binding protein
MVSRSTRLRWRRVFRRKQKQVGEFGVQAEQNVEQLLIRRFGRLFSVRRFVASWVALVVLLSVVLVAQFRVLNKTWQSKQPAPGGIYTEGMVGTFTNANPLYTTSQADATVSRLVFAGLLKYDDRNRLIGDLAQSWSVSKDNLTYNVVLRPDLKWQDGQPLTADDVVFTFQTAQNPDAKSSLFRSWRGIEVSAKDEQTVVFTLNTAFAPFPHSLTTGIVPKHLLEKIPVSELRSATFNTDEPVGAGPFAWSSVEVASNSYQYREQRIGLTPSDQYHGGRPKLDGFVVRTYQEQDQMLEDFRSQKLSAIVGLEAVPDELKDLEDVRTYDTILAAQVAAFFKTDSPLLADAGVRQAMVRSVDVPKLVGEFQDPVRLSDSPLLKGQVGYDASLVQLQYNLSAAEKLLEQKGWKMSQDGVRKKGNARLQLKLVAQSTPRFSMLAAELEKAWRAIGVDVSVSLLSDAEIRTVIRDRNYDILLYGISIGVDPDVFPYWHSTQKDPRSGLRLNFSNYSSAVVDSSLEAGRSRSDPVLRTAKYKPFLTQWRQDAPALILYQPRFAYITNTPLFGFTAKEINTSTDRLNSVSGWEIEQTLQPKP